MFRLTTLQKWLTTTLAAFTTEIAQKITDGKTQNLHALATAVAGFKQYIDGKVVELEGSLKQQVEGVGSQTIAYVERAQHDVNSARAADVAKFHAELDKMREHYEEQVAQLREDLKHERERSDNAINRLMMSAAQLSQPMRQVSPQAPAVAEIPQFNPFEELKPGDPEGYNVEELGIGGYQEPTAK
jgi:hypothetical protein